MSNKIRRSEWRDFNFLALRIEAEAAKENKWLTPKVKAKAEANPEQALEALALKDEMRWLWRIWKRGLKPAGSHRALREVGCAAVLSLKTPGSHGVRRIRRQRRSLRARTWKPWP